MSDEQPTTNYDRYWQAAFNRPEHYPLGVWPDPARYQPLGAWIGRLILPARDERADVMGSWIELHHTPPEHQALIGQRARLRWTQTPDHHARFWGVTRMFTSTRKHSRRLPQARFSPSDSTGWCMSTRSNHWRRPTPTTI